MTSDQSDYDREKRREARNEKFKGARHSFQALTVNLRYKHCQYYSGTTGRDEVTLVLSQYSDLLSIKTSC